VIPAYLPQLLLEAVVTTALSLILFRTSLTFLAIFLGAVELIITIMLPPNSVTGLRQDSLIYSSLLLSTLVFFGVLLVFLSRGVDETRRLVFGLFFGIVCIFAVLWLVGFNGIQIFFVPAIFSRLLIILAGSILVVYIYSQLYQRLPRIPGIWLILLALLGASAIDQILLRATQGLSLMLPQRLLPPPSLGMQSMVRLGIVLWFSGVLALIGRYKGFQVEEFPVGKRFSLTNFITYRQQYEIARNIAIRDELTGLYNRRHFNETFPREVERAKRYNQPLSLAFIDIDHFKRINDTYGHSAGDTILVEVAQVLMNNSRDIDIIFRYGGEEFVILLPSTSKSGAVTAMNKLRERVSQIDISGFGSEIKTVTVSVGLAICPDETSSGSELVTLADKRLFAAKGAGRNQVVATEDIPTTITTT